MSDVVGWSEPEVLAEYRQAVEVAQKGTAVPWRTRQAYLSTVQRAARELTRSLDFAQPGEPMPVTVRLALEEASAALAAYDQAVAVARG